MNNDYIDHPLGLPKGSIRALLVLILTIFFAFCIYVDHEIPYEIGAVWLSGVSYYLGHRSS